MVRTFVQFFQILESYGLTDALLPFLLIFTVIFAIMQKTKPLGDKKAYNVVTALVIALIVVIPHVLGRYPYHADPVLIINRAIPNIAAVIVACVLLLIMLGLFGAEAAWSSKGAGVIAIIGIIVVLYIFGRAAGWFGPGTRWWRWLDDPSTQAIIIIVIIFAILIWYITREEKKPGVEETGTGKKLLEEVRDIFKKSE